MSNLQWSYQAAWAITIIGLMVCVTFLFTVVLSQRHFRAMEKMKNEGRRLDADLKLAQIQEKQVNGRTADDVIEIAQAIERRAKAEDKLANAVERRIRSEAKLSEQPALEGGTRDG